MAIPQNLIGVRLGGYKIREFIGSGGMGSVYLAYDRANKRDVAIKVVSSGALLPDALDRFRREAKLAAALSHPNIVQVYHFDEDSGVLYMVQEYLRGPSLAKKMRQGGRRPGIAAVHKIVAQLAAALDYAHGQGVIHRDVKPDNAIFKDENLDRIILTDFGLAREDDLRKTATGPGVVMGTPAYIAPEQAVGGRGLTKACDIYALGVLTFEMLTGKLPFEADTPMGVILKHLYDDPPPPRSLRAELPKAVDSVILRALHKEPEKRFPSAGAFADALYATLPDNKAGTARSRHTSTTTAKPATPRKTTTETAPAVKEATRPRRTRATPATNPPPQPAPPVEAASKSTPAAPVNRDRMMRLRVGLITACIVGTLVLIGSGVDLDNIHKGWFAFQALIGR